MVASLFVFHILIIDFQYLLCYNCLTKEGFIWQEKLYLLWSISYSCCYLSALSLRLVKSMDLHLGTSCQSHNILFFLVLSFFSGYSLCLPVSIFSGALALHTTLVSVIVSVATILYMLYCIYNGRSEDNTILWLSVGAQVVCRIVVRHLMEDYVTDAPTE